MEIYLLRHGIAEDSHPGGDEARRLTADGREKCVQAAAGLRALAARFTVVWTSPLVRARETAELVAPSYTAEVHESLANAPVKELLADLQSLPPDAVVLLVGHEPQMSRTIEHLLGASTGWVAMKKSGLAHLVVDLRRWPNEPAVLVSLLTPRQLRMLGGGD